MRRGSVGLLVACVLVAGCSSSSSGTQTINVYAASSLTETFTTLAHRFEHDHANVHVELNFGASSALATSIVNGAPADVFASASPGPMKTVVTASAATSSSLFASNVLEIAVAPGNPKQITGLADLSRKGLKVALCDPAVPCGAAAKQALDGAGVHVDAVSLQADVKATLTTVRLREVDAALVYLTDVRAAGTTVTGVPIPAADNARTEYPIAVLSNAKPRDPSRAFVSLVLSSAGQTILRLAGFGSP